MIPPRRPAFSAAAGQLLVTRAPMAATKSSASSSRPSPSPRSAQTSNQTSSKPNKSLFSLQGVSSVKIQRLSQTLVRHRTAFLRTRLRREGLCSLDSRQTLNPVKACSGALMPALLCSASRRISLLKLLATMPRKRRMMMMRVMIRRSKVRSHLRFMRTLRRLSLREPEPRASSQAPTLSSSR